ncbi:MAG: hypothetical protein R2911_23895 [Caldilineaceae bacterium]
MKIGIFDNTFKRPTLEATLDAVADAEVQCAQLRQTHWAWRPCPAVSDAVCADSGGFCGTQYGPVDAFPAPSA